MRPVQIARCSFTYQILCFPSTSFEFYNAIQNLVGCIQITFLIHNNPSKITGSYLGRSLCRPFVNTTTGRYKNISIAFIYGQEPRFKVCFSKCSCHSFRCYFPDFPFEHIGQNYISFRIAIHSVKSVKACLYSCSVNATFISGQSCRPS